MEYFIFIFRVRGSFCCYIVLLRGRKLRFRRGLGFCVNERGGRDSNLGFINFKFVRLVFTCYFMIFFFVLGDVIYVISFLEGF